MARIPSRITLIGAGFVLAALAVTGRAAQLQLAQGARWRARAAAQQTTRVVLPARRGTLYDRNGVALALSQDTYGVGIAPRELDDERQALELLSRALGLPRSQVAAAIRSRRVWAEWPGPYTWSAVAPLKNLRGVYLQRRLERFYPRPDIAARLIGRTGADGHGASGLERAFDSLLVGRAGTAVMLRDNRGRLYPSPSRPITEPSDGANVVLTLDAELQEIADRALRLAVSEARAAGGDVIILQPETGDVLALASVQSDGTAASLVGAAFEPGSTAKVFTAAALLRAGKATPLDTVFAENGSWATDGRTIHDTHPSGRISLEDVIRVSSNIGIAKLGSRMTLAEQFEALRDFGFGTMTGIELPGESPGTLRPIRRWTVESPASLAMGYEFAVTPLQLAAAYGSFANEGLLLEPTLVREVQDPDGTVRARHRPRAVRRVVSPQVAQQITHMLLGVVEEGTGRRAALGTYQVAGKTGTSRRAVGGRYAQGQYWASFVGLFPAADPQLVLVVKIDDPAGDYFGGSTAAPVTRAILEAALATQNVSLDRGRLSRRRVLEAAVEPSVAATAPVVVVWPARAATDSVPLAARPVPSVSGLGLRAAARTLHRAGFRVRVEGWGTVTGSSPAAGVSAPAGSVVVVRAEGTRAS